MKRFVSSLSFTQIHQLYGILQIFSKDTNQTLKLRFYSNFPTLLWKKVPVFTIREK